MEVNIFIAAKQCCCACWYALVVERLYLRVSELDF